MRAFQALRLESGYSYRPTEEVIADPILTSIVRRDMEREWRQLKHRYDQFDEFRDLVLSDLGVPAA